MTLTVMQNISIVSSYSVWVLFCFSLPLPLHLCARSSALSFHSSSPTTFYSFPLAEGGIKPWCCYFDASPDIPLPGLLVSKVSDCRPWASSQSCIPRSPGVWGCAELSRWVQPKGAGLNMTGANTYHLYFSENPLGICEMSMEGYKCPIPLVSLLGPGSLPLHCYFPLKSSRT